MKQLLAILVVTLATGGRAHAGDTAHTAGQLLEDCEARALIFAQKTASAPYGVGTTTQIENAAACFAYLDGFADGYLSATSNSRGINFPEVSSSLDYIDVFVNYMLRHPELKGSPRFVGVYRA